MENGFLTQIKINSTLGNELVTVQEAKDYIRVDTSADDNLISAMISQSRLWCENYISKDIVSKNRTYYLRDVNDRFELPFAPISSISEVTVDGSVVADYEVYGIDDSIIELPTLPSKEVKVTYVTSGISGSLIKNAMMQLVSTYYDNRSDFKEQKFEMIPTDVRTMLTSYKSLFI